MTDAIHIRRVDGGCRGSVLALRVHAGQRAWVGDIADLLADAEACPGCEALALMHGAHVVGFCRIDPGTASITGRSWPMPALGLRGFLIAAGAQGRGLGRMAVAALCADLARRHPQRSHLVLSVAPDNLAALACYRRAGFRAAGTLYHGAPCGPLQVMQRPLVLPPDNPRMVVHADLPT